MSEEEPPPYPGAAQKTQTVTLEGSREAPSFPNGASPWTTPYPPDEGAANPPPSAVPPDTNSFPLLPPSTATGHGEPEGPAQSPINLPSSDGDPAIATSPPPYQPPPTHPEGTYPPT